MLVNVRILWELKYVADISLSTVCVSCDHTIEITPLLQILSTQKQKVMICFRP